MCKRINKNKLLIKVRTVIKYIKYRYIKYIRQDMKIAQKVHFSPILA